MWAGPKCAPSSRIAGLLQVEGTLRYQSTRLIDLNDVLTGAHFLRPRPEDTSLHRGVLVVHFALYAVFAFNTVKFETVVAIIS